MVQWIFTIYFYTIALFLFGITGIITFFISIFLPGIFYTSLKILCRIFLITIGVKLKIKGKFPDGGPFIVMANHGSLIDPFLWGAFMDRKFTGIIARKNLKYPVYGWLLRRLKAIPIDRKNRENAIKGIKKAEEVIKEGYHIGIHPEGTRTLHGKMNPLKKGGFHMAINTNTPILPVGFNGAFNFKPKTRVTIKPGKISVKIGEPILPEIYNSLTMDELISFTENKLKILSGEIHETK